MGRLYESLLELGFTLSVLKTSGKVWVLRLHHPIDGRPYDLRSALGVAILFVGDAERIEALENAGWWVMRHRSTPETIQRVKEWYRYDMAGTPQEERQGSQA